MLNHLDAGIWKMIADGILETLYMTLSSTGLAYVVGMPLGILLVSSDKDGVSPRPTLHKAVGAAINVMRSIPFLILAILVIPLTRAIVGTSIGSTAMIVPLFIAAAPFVARLVEASLQEVDRGVIEAAWAMGSSPGRIITKVLLPEARSSLILGAAIAVTTILGYSAMAGILAGGGLGDIAIRFGYYRYQTDIMWVTVILLIVIVQVLQLLGERGAKITDKRLSHTYSGKAGRETVSAKTPPPANILDIDSDKN
jgi:D-methionine transport system permease protein